MKEQTCAEFEWLIVDDGSCDGTASVVQEMMADAKFPIKYIRKENGGKHTALNLGISNIDSLLTIIVDSDDWLDSEAIATICAVHEVYRHKREICGYVFLRKFPNGEINGKQFQEDGLIDSYIHTRINTKDIGSDKAEVFLTACLREFPFPEYQN